ncbi:50S ribosomal protein L29 [candidate division TA06 bacterium DG_26]|uniref:Large ribosomal subunit protein uL29 n=1 Tax=candidate division TA06 bacterium DG_26 TaxID=1703771 RepID=A0A0S7WKH8_UNCT6|nr:MAG: 50S ribosomal protein L29 [candidate division TA06 bacterium DG_26]
MKARDLRQYTVEELRTRVYELEEELFNLRFRHVTSELPNPLRIRAVRREIARIRTILREDQRGMRKIASKRVE